MTNIILLGPPGCGKGTQSKILVEEKGFLQISTGDLLRRTADTKTSFGNEINNIMKRGDLVPDNVVIKMILDEITNKYGKNFIFDGFPRNLNQAEKLDEAFSEKKIKIDFVVLLDVRLDILEQRIEKRIKEAGHENVRQDDNVNTLTKRVETYKSMTMPLVQYYTNQNKLTKINGMDSIESISKKINTIITN
tara:strand:- start:314 stop:889 length:576 start_codon:yes stop_codon:yes gene_type:complete